MSETCTRYSSACDGEALADATADGFGSGGSNDHTLCAPCLASLIWNTVRRNGDKYASNLATVTITELVGDEDKAGVQRLVLIAMQSEYSSVPLDENLRADGINWNVR